MECRAGGGLRRRSWHWDGPGPPGTAALPTHARQGRLATTADFTLRRVQRQERSSTAEPRPAHPRSPEQAGARCSSTASDFAPVSAARGDFSSQYWRGLTKIFQGGRWNTASPAGTIEPWSASNLGRPGADIASGVVSATHVSDGLPDCIRMAALIGRGQIRRKPRHTPTCSEEAPPRLYSSVSQAVYFNLNIRQHQDYGAGQHDGQAAAARTTSRAAWQRNLGQPTSRHCSAGVGHRQGRQAACHWAARG